VLRWLKVLVNFKAIKFLFDAPFKTDRNESKLRET